MKLNQEIELIWEIGLDVQYPFLVTGPSLGFILVIESVLKVGRPTYFVR